MQYTITAINPWTSTETEVKINVWNVLPSGYGHKRVTFRVDHPENQFENPYEFSITTTDMELFDQAKDMGYDEGNKLIIDNLIGDSIDTAMEIGEWLQRVAEKNDEKELEEEA
jgi:hypothetical protein